MKLPADRQLLCICRRIASVGIVLLFLVLLSVTLFCWRGYMLNYPDPITGTVPSRFPVIAEGHPNSNSGMGTHELVPWEQWERRQKQGTAYVWVKNRTGEGQQDREARRPLFYRYRMTELGPQRYMVHVTVTDGDDLQIRAQSGSLRSRTALMDREGSPQHRRLYERWIRQHRTPLLCHCLRKPLSCKRTLKTQPFFASFEPAFLRCPLCSWHAESP